METVVRMQFTDTVSIYTFILLWLYSSLRSPQINWTHRQRHFFKSRSLCILYTLQSHTKEQDCPHLHPSGREQNFPRSGWRFAGKASQSLWTSSQCPRRWLKNKTKYYYTKLSISWMSFDFHSIYILGDLLHLIFYCHFYVHGSTSQK